MRRLLRSLLLGLALSLTGCGYNTMQAQDEQISANWAEVQNQYQRRLDLIPNLVNTVKAYAAHEQKVLTEVTQARASVGSLRVDSSIINDPAALGRFQASQAQLGNALQRLMLIAEQYPNLKADQNFRDLQAQLEGTENRIAVARGRYIKAVQDYNTTVRSFPSNLTARLFGMQVKPSFTASNPAAETPPTVDFSNPGK